MVSIPEISKFKAPKSMFFRTVKGVWYQVQTVTLESQGQEDQEHKVILSYTEVKAQITSII